MKALLLAGGRSTRMGTPKHLLPMPDGRPIYQHLVDTLHAACPEADDVYISLAQESLLDDRLRHAALPGNNTESKQTRRPTLRILYDARGNNTTDSAGPAAGLLATHRAHPDATWLVVGCDYPFVTVEALSQLREMHAGPVTCFRNDEGFCEPLVGIWGPKALERLAENDAKGRSGPSAVVRELDGLTIRPNGACSTKVLCNVNTPQEWEAAQGILTR